MPNVISSAIVNTPPSEMLADVLNKRNRLHHFDANTDEGMIPIFTHDVDGKARNNKRLLPRRNWCSIREYQPGESAALRRSTRPELTDSQGSTPPGTPSEPESPSAPEHPGKQKGDKPPGGLLRRLSRRGPPPEMGDGNLPPRGPAAPRPGTFHRRATNLSRKGARKTAKEGDDGAGGYVRLEGGLDITLNVEISAQDPAGITVPYKLLVPALWYEDGLDPNPAPRPKGWKKWFGRRKKKASYLEEGPASDGEEDEEDYESHGDRWASDEGLPYGPQANEQDDGDDDDDEEEDGLEANARPKKRWFGRG
ncbi:hypothetical protein VTN02DRAFT_3718 [Thermoascus thermophilus]